MWGAAWLFRATNDVTYFNFLKSVGDDSGTDIFSWDNKYAGAHVLLARVNFHFIKSIKNLVIGTIFYISESFFIQFLFNYIFQRALLNKDRNFEQYRQEAENFMCKILPNSPMSSTQYTQGKLTKFHAINYMCV